MKRDKQATILDVQAEALAIVQAARGDREPVATLLEDRADALAKAVVLEEDLGPILEVVEFELADERYAIELSVVREVYPLDNLTPVPNTPPFVLGIINFRGQIVSILDLGILLDLSPDRPHEPAWVILLQNEQMEFGIRVDGILGVTEIPVRALQAPPQTLSGRRAEYLHGISGDRVVVLDGAKILGDEQLVVHAELGV